MSFTNYVNFVKLLDFYESWFPYLLSGENSLTEFLWSLNEKRAIYIRAFRKCSINVSHTNASFQRSPYCKTTIPTANSIFSDERLKVFPLESETKQGCPLPLFAQAYLGGIASLVPDHSNKANITIKWVTQIVLVSQCIQKLCLYYAVVC